MRFRFILVELLRGHAKKESWKRKRIDNEAKIEKGAWP